MDSISLPERDSASLRLAHPTDREKVEQWTKNGATWKGALSLEAYLRRERYLLQAPLAKDGGITHWILVDSDAEDRKVFAGCETLKKRALVAKNGDVVDVVCHGIGSVFSPPEFRGRGFGRRLMTEMGPQLETWQTEKAPCLFSVLFSDIGKQFYAKNGWHPFPSAHISIPATMNAVKAVTGGSPLYSGDLLQLCETDEKLLRQQLSALDPKAAKPTIAIVPDIATIRWHHAREEFVATELYGKAPTIKGAMTGTEIGKRVWCYWTRVWHTADPLKRNENTMFILRLVVEDAAAAGTDNAIASLFTMALEEAETWGMGEVQMWNPAEPAVAAAQLLYPQATVVHREEESIVCLRWHGNIDDADSDVSATEQCIWVGNEKYGWC
ncbi:MAG: hypothetical protein Q9157_008414 [Trypethelium eluteriae]